MQTRSHVCARRHVSRYLHTLPHPCAHAHSPTFVSTQAPSPGILASPSLYPTTALPTGTHVHHTWQRAHIQTPLPPPWLWAPRIRARRAGWSHRQDGSTSAPPPGGRQVQGPRPRQAGREGALITRPLVPTHTFHPGHARPGPRRSLPPPARSLAPVGGGTGVRRTGPARGEGAGRCGSEAAPPRLHGYVGAVGRGPWGSRGRTEAGRRSPGDLRRNPGSRRAGGEHHWSRHEYQPRPSSRLF